VPLQSPAPSRCSSANARAQRMYQDRSLGITWGFAAQVDARWRRRAARACARTIAISICWHDLFPCLRSQTALGFFRRSLAEFADRAPTCQHTLALAARTRAAFPPTLLTSEGGPMRRQSRSVPPPNWHPTLKWIVEAAEHECPRGHARALRDLTALAMDKVPS